MLQYIFVNKKILLATAGIAATLFFSAQFVFAADTAMQHYNKGTASWNPVDNVKCYNVYYKEMSDTKYVHAVRCVPKNMTSYVLGYLKQGVTYKYNVSAVLVNGKESSWSSEKTLSVSSMK